MSDVKKFFFLNLMLVLARLHARPMTGQDLTEIFTKGERK